MSIQLSNNEKILRTYDYATAKSRGLAAAKRSKTLIITNKRIIHKEISKGANTTSVNMSEMPIETAKYIRTSFKKTGYPILIVFAVLAAIVGTIMLILLKNFIPFLITGIMAAICIFIYIKKKDYAFSCSIDTNTHITNAFNFSSISGSSRTRGIFAIFGSANKNFSIKVKVNSEVAQQMANELGYVIAAAANGDFDSAENAE